MTTVEDIEKAIAALKPEEIERLRVWFAQFHPAQPGAASPEPAEPPAKTAPAGGSVRHPHVAVRLNDLKGEVGPIIRRVSYAMSDAGVGDDEIARYKDQVRAGGNPVAVTKRWVRVE